MAQTEFVFNAGRLCSFSGSGWSNEDDILRGLLSAFVATLDFAKEVGEGDISQV